MLYFGDTSEYKESGYTEMAIASSAKNLPYFCYLTNIHTIKKPPPVYAIKKVLKFHRNSST